MDHETRCAELYAEGNRPMDVPDGLLVIGSMKCGLCKQSMRNNDYPRTASDGTPVTWINLGEENGLYKFYTTPGIRWDEEQQSAMAGEHKLGGTPFALWVQGGAVQGGPLSSGEIAEGGIDALIAKARARAA